MFRISVLLICFFSMCQQGISQDKPSLNSFIENAKQNAPALHENDNLLQIGAVQNEIIRAQNKALKVDATSEVLFAPYFNSDGKFIDVTTMPSPNAFGYDVGITNGGLYSAQINVTQNLLNKAIVDNLLFQNKINNQGLELVAEDIERNLIKNITDTYVMAYQLQLQADFTKDILKDLRKRLEVLELLVKHGILQESDYLLLQLDIESKELEHEQIEINFQVVINQLFTLSGSNARILDSLEKPNLKLKDTFTGGKRYYQRKFINDSLRVLADQRVFENNYKPQLSAYGNTGINAVEIRNIAHRIGLSAGLRLTIPIYDGKKRFYNAQQSKLKEENLKFYRDNAAVQLKNRLEAINGQMTALQKNQEHLKKQIKNQENVLEIYKGKLVQGQVSIVDYLSVVQNYKQNIYTQMQMQTNMWLLQSQYNFINW